MERTGTTWIHENLIKHPEVDYYHGKENEFLKFEKDVVVFDPETDLKNYVDHYRDYDVSFCNNPKDWMLSTRTITLLNNVVTHFGISFRNPFEMIKSWYNFSTIHLNSEIFKIWEFENSNWFEDRVNEGYIDYVAILEKINPVVKKPFKIMILDDLVKDPKKYLNELQEFIGIAKTDLFFPNKANKRIYLRNLDLTNSQCKLINEKIDQFSDYMKRDFSHWKM